MKEALEDNRFVQYHQTNHQNKSFQTLEAIEFVIQKQEIKDELYKAIIKAQDVTNPANQNSERAKPETVDGDSLQVKEQFCNDDFKNKLQLFSAEQIEEEQIIDYNFTNICKHLLQDQKYEQYLSIFLKFFQNTNLNMEQKEDLLLFVIVIKLNFEKLPQIENNYLEKRIIDYYILLKDRIKKELDIEYQNQFKNSENYENINCYQYQNQVLPNGTIERQKKQRKIDHSLILVDKLDTIKNKDRLNESVDMLLTISLQVKEMFQEEIKDQEKKDYYMNKLQKFSQKKIMKKFEIKQFKDNQYNFISQYLIRQENEESLKILLSCFIEYTFQWINLLDFKQNGKSQKFKQKENSQTFKEIQKFLKQKIIEQTTIKLGIQNYFQNKTYQKFDFIEFVINLLKIYQELKNLEIQEWIIDQQQQEIDLQQLDAYQQQLFHFLKSISEMKLDRYKQKMNINFSLKTFKKLISCDAKPEVLNAIKAAKRKPKQFLNELILNDEEIKDFQEAIEKLRKKAKKQ